MDYHREWQYDAQPGDIVESTCCPCLVYGRANLRLKIASDMRDGRNMKAAADSTPNFPLLSSACCAFASCLPFYGCFISSLRGRVRDFYDIDGTNGQDLAWICPKSPYDFLLEFKLDKSNNHSQHRMR
ncbi:hypothetical protein BHE90_014760 [Fusarium euwallaceae]|uniref:Uncharacterized protein n=1 Tax=Fusarium euwallaceae TaxID=1147111 RepID=A0A430L573_9HYPO|nr:hypothetical protein BHE90_014760 [Fusarium euwallaceae]